VKVSLPRLPDDKPWLLVGDCAGGEENGGGNRVAGCPPDRQELLEGLIKTLITYSHQRGFVSNPLIFLNGVHSLPLVGLYWWFTLLLKMCYIA